MGIGHSFDCHGRLAWLRLSSFRLQRAITMQCRVLKAVQSHFNQHLLSTVSARKTKGVNNLAMTTSVLALYDFDSLLR